MRILVVHHYCQEYVVISYIIQMFLQTVLLHTRESFSSYKRIITIPLLNYLLTEMNDRFSNHHQIVLQGLFLVLSVLITLCKLENQDFYQI